MSGYYDTAQVCLNGHVINDNFHEHPAHNQEYCDKCGEPTIFKCPNCQTEIRGSYEVPHVIGGGGISSAPNFCHKCGKSYPWLAKKLEAIREMTDELEELSDKEKERLKNSLDDIVAETPKNRGCKFTF